MIKAKCRVDNKIIDRFARKARIIEHFGARPEVARVQNTTKGAFEQKHARARTVVGVKQRQRERAAASVEHDTLANADGARVLEQRRTEPGAEQRRRSSRANERAQIPRRREPGSVVHVRVRAEIVEAALGPLKLVNANRSPCEILADHVSATVSVDRLVVRVL